MRRRRRSVTKRELLLLRVLEYISQEGHAPRAEIARALKLSKATVTHITRDLIDHGIAAEVADLPDTQDLNTSSGRPSVPLQVNPDAGLLIGIDLSGSRVAAVVLNMALAQHVRLEFEHPALRHSALPQDLVSSVVDGIMTTLGPDSARVRGIGISVRALNYQVDDTGDARLMDVKANAALVDALITQHRIPVAVIHNMQALLLAEMMRRPSSGLRLLIHVGEGIGGAIWLENKPIEGAHLAAGEWGHITVDRNGPVCACGKRGCIEASYAVPHLVERARTHDPRVTSWEDFVAHVDAPACQAILHEFIEAAAHALSGPVLVCDPEEIIVDGPICDVADAFLPQFSQALAEELLPRTRRALTLTTSMGGVDTAARGAAYSLIGKALEHMVTTPLVLKP